MNGRAAARGRGVDRISCSPSAAVYDVVAAPGRITDIVLEAGEALVDTNPIAAGDTVRWVIGDTTSGEGASRRVHVLVKPVQGGLSTNLIINTSRRTYHLQLRASSRAFLSQVSGAIRRRRHGREQARRRGAAPWSRRLSQRPIQPA
jgi:P-type conjugative transfer protein TrbG